MYTFKVGDLIAANSNSNGLILKTGIVVRSGVEHFVVKWTSYNKDFFMEKEGEIFNELNNLYLLSLQSINRKNEEAFLSLLNAS